MLKNKKIIIFSIIGILFLFFSVLLVIHFIGKKDELSFENIKFNNLTELNYNDFNLETFIDGVICNEDCYYNDEKLEYYITDVSSLGTQNIVVTVIYKGEKYEKTYNIELVDKSSPIITLSTNKIEIKVGEDFDPNKYILQVSDNFDEMKVENIKIENNVNISKANDYTVNYSITDSSNNTTTVSLIVSVLENEEKENNDDISDNSSSSNKPDSPENSNSSSIKNLINKASLSPLKTGHTTLDNKLNSIISSNTNSSMSKYDKLKSVYDYVKKKISYRTSPINMNDVISMQEEYGYYEYDALIIYQALYSLDTGYGVCDNYASLFMLLARRLGFDAYTVSGKVNKAGGGTTGHTWVMIKLSGKYYIFDPQIEDTRGSDYFAKTDSQLPIYYYTLSSNINNFKFFKKDPNVTRAFTLNVSVTGAYTNKASIDSEDREPVYYDYATIDLNSTININLNLSIKQKYNIVLTVDDKTISDSSFSGTTKTIKQTFDKEGIYDVILKITSGNHTLYYYLTVTVKD